jgi:hypothetical protein
MSIVDELSCICDKFLMLSARLRRILTHIVMDLEIVLDTVWVA